MQTHQSQQSNCNTTTNAEWSNSIREFHKTTHQPWKLTQRRLTQSCCNNILVFPSHILLKTTRHVVHLNRKSTFHQTSLKHVQICTTHDHGPPKQETVRQTTNRTCRNHKQYDKRPTEHTETTITELHIQTALFNTPFDTIKHHVEKEMGRKYSARSHTYLTITIM